MRFNVINAVFRRNVASFFTSVLGYLFIVSFVVAVGWLTFSPRFFVANEPSLDQLSESFLLLLLFIIPAITMTTWSDERKLGTDELLFTLPATDFEILIGKYLSVLAVYSVTLLFATVQIIGLAYLGNPDFSVLFTTYLGYWLAGAALISAGMLASSLTSNTTVAFVLGVLICSVPIFFGYLFRFFNWTALSFHENLRDFTLGIVPMSGLLFFVAFTVVMLYLNYVVISRRHWSSSQKVDMGLQYSIRSICLVVTLASVCFVAGKMAFSFDGTTEGLYSLSEGTRNVLEELETDIVIEAYVSPEVPEDYVARKKQLDGLLKQYVRLGGGRVTYQKEEITRFSEKAEAARKDGIETESVQEERDGRVSVEDIYLGAVVKSTTTKRQQVIPFFGRDLPIEYELTRSIQTVARTRKLVVGILATEAELLNRPRGEWAIVRELRKQYHIVDVSPDAELDPEFRRKQIEKRAAIVDRRDAEDEPRKRAAIDRELERFDEADKSFDVLLAAMPSSLTQPQMTNFVNYVRGGAPVLIFDDPFPIEFIGQMGVQKAPRTPKQSPGGGMMGMQMPSQPKAENGQLTSLQKLLGFQWDNGEAVFEMAVPHAEFEAQTRLFVFVSKSNGNRDAFGQSSRVSSGLQEVVALVPGDIRADESRDDINFEKLIVTGAASGVLSWDDYTMTIPNPMTRQMLTRPQIPPNDELVPDRFAHILAAHITSDEGDGLNAVFVTDLDMISDMFFSEWTDQRLPVRFDNVTFVLNAVDVLAGVDSFVDLRTRRPEHRSLRRLDEENLALDKQLQENLKKNRDAEKAEIKVRQDTLDAMVKKIRDDKEMDPRTKSIRIQDAEARQQRLLDVTRANLALKTKRLNDEEKAKIKRKRQSIENYFRGLMIALPALPPILIGLLVLGIRMSAERQTIVPSRRRKSA